MAGIARRQPLVARDLVHRSWWWIPGSRNKDKAKRRSARRERAAAREEIRLTDYVLRKRKDEA